MNHARFNMGIPKTSSIENSSTRPRVHAHGSVEVELVAAFLSDLKRAYDSILLFETIVDRMRRAAHDFPTSLYLFGPDFGWPLASRRAGPRARYWPPTAEEIASFVPRSEQLILFAVSLSSPGFWEFLGTLNPLEVLRKYLNDRHERRKDHDYRESAEERRLDLENSIIETALLSGKVKLAREMGATDRDLAPLLNELIHKPLVALDRYQDKGVIEHAEIPSSHDRP
jgi:hypothetical protein